MNDADIRTLITSAVDAELGGRRAVPTRDRATLLDLTASNRSVPGRSRQGRSGLGRSGLGRSGLGRRVAAWTVPVLTASAVALLAAGSIMAIDHRQDNRSNQVGEPDPGSSASPVGSEPESSPSLAYAKAAAGAPEASEVAGVSVRPAPGSPDGYGTPFAGKTVVPGKSYSFTVNYLVPLGDDPVSLLTITLRFVASGSCPKPFLIRPGHLYRIRCQVTFLTTAAGELMVSRQSPTGLTTQDEPLLDSHGP